MPRGLPPDWLIALLTCIIGLWMLCFITRRFMLLTSKVGLWMLCFINRRFMLSCKEEAKKVADHLLPFENNEMDSDSEGDVARGELHEMLSPSNSWTNSAHSIVLNFYFIHFVPVPNDRLYQNFGLFVKDPLPREAEEMELDLHLAHRTIVKTKLVPSGVIECRADEIMQAQKFQELFLKIVLDREEYFADFVPLGEYASEPSFFYLLLPLRKNTDDGRQTIDWKLISRCLSSPVFGAKGNTSVIPDGNSLVLADGLSRTTDDIVNSLVFTPHNKLFFFVDGIHYAQKFNIPKPLLKAKKLFSLHNLLHNRGQGNKVARELEEHFVILPPELCTLKIIGFSKEIGSSLSLLPSLMHRLENLLVAIELKSVFVNSFPEGNEVTAHRVLEAITTEKCMERFSLERLEVLGDAFLKYAVGRHLFLMNESIDEGQLTRQRSSIVNNTHLYKLAIRSNLQVYIRDENFDPSQFFAFGRPCTVICNEHNEMSIHFQPRHGNIEKGVDSNNVKCSKGHHWLHRKTIADVVEALVGAFLVDSGFKAAVAFLKWIGIQVDFDASHVSEACMASNSYMSLSSCIDTSTLEKSLGYRFLHKGLLLQAFVHPSYNKHIGGFQRLEFLGDAVLDYLITSYLFSVYPKLKPGQLTDLRSATVNNNVFAHVSVFRSFHTHLLSDSAALSEAVQKFVSYSQSSPEEQKVNEEPRIPKALGDLVESCIGAILLDSGFNLNIVWKIMLSFLDPIMNFSGLQLDPVRELTELCQSKSWDLQYSYNKNGGAFVVDASVIVEGAVHSTGCGINQNKKAARRTAAHQILLKLKEEGYVPKKSNSLKELLESSEKQEAKLIGFNEAPSPVVILDHIQLENLKLNESSPSTSINGSATSIPS